MSDVPRPAADAVPLEQLLGESPAIVAVREQVRRLLGRQSGGARRPAPILILGETGTGKGLLAGILHRAGPRAAGPFVDVNCAAIPESLLEAELFGFERGAFTDARHAKPGLLQIAHRGMLFLDEVGLLPEALQAKLLKVLEEGSVRRLGSTRSEPVDVWIVSATSEDLLAATPARRFREDLYHRLAILTLSLPPLRERSEDVVRLAEHFLRQACADYGLAPRMLAPQAHAALVAHPWPGNVRELANMMERVALLSDAPTVTAALLGLPPAPRPGSSGARPAGERRGALDAEGDVERARVLEALRATRWNLSRAAVRLGVPRNTLRYRMEKLGLSRRGRASPPALGTSGAGVSGAPAGAPASGLPEESRPAAGVRWEPRRVALLRARVAAGAGARDTSRAIEMVLDKVRSFGGTVDELGATGVVAVFGLEPLDDAPRRAAYASLAIQRAVAARPGEAGPPNLALALHTERLPVARVGGALEVDADAKRRVRQILEALADRAEPGAAAVSPQGAALLARRFELVPAGSVAGMPGQAHRLVGAATAPRDSGRFVGRLAELALLGERFEQARAGEGQVVFVAGEPGIGKSRLLREFRRACGDAAPWLEGQAMPFGRAMPFHPLIDLFRRASGIGEGDEEAMAAGRLHAWVLGLGADLASTLPFLRDLLTFDPADPALAAMDPNARRAGILDAVRRVFLRVAERGSVILVLEDVHWADQATLEFLAGLADRLATRRVLMILTARPGHPSPVGDRSFHTRLPLTSLSARDSVEVARRLLEGATIPEGLEALIVRKVSGNPFFVEEMVRMLQDLGALQRGGEGWRLTEPPERITLPDTVEDVILARVERLGEAARQTLDVASVIGTDVPMPLLQGVAELSRDSLQEALQDLQASELLYEVGLVPVPEYTFKHAVIQEVVYRQVSPGRRRVLHGRLVDAIERNYGDRLGEHADRLAYHASRGERWAQALDYAQQAAARARTQSAYREMAAFLELAVEALERLPRTATTLGDGVDLRFGLRDAYNALREPERVLRWLREAETLAQALSDPLRLARVASYMTQHFWVEGRHAQAIEVGQRALDRAKALGNLGLQVATAFYLGRARYALGEYAEAIRHLAWAVTSLEGGLAYHRYGVAGLPSVLSRIWLAWCYAECGRLAEAVACGDEAVQIATAGDDFFTRVGARAADGRARLRRGDVGRAIAGLEEGLRLAREWDIPVWVPIVSAELGAAYVQAGRFPEAIRLLEHALTTPWKVDLALWTVWLGEAHLRTGRLGEATRHAERALGLARAHGERGNEAYAHRLQAEIASVGEEPDGAATEHYRRSLALATELGMRPLVAWCHAGLATLHRRHRADDLAASHLAAATALCAELDMVLGSPPSEGHHAHAPRDGAEPGTL
jgi:DNA-binding NtrC family response regulator/tetratricopeptide (TPR) repeat protein